LSIDHSYEWFASRHVRARQKLVGNCRSPASCSRHAVGTHIDTPKIVQKRAGEGHEVFVLTDVSGPTVRRWLANYQELKEAIEPLRLTMILLRPERDVSKARASSLIGGDERQLSFGDGLIARSQHLATTGWRGREVLQMRRLCDRVRALGNASNSRRRAHGRGGAAVVTLNTSE